MEYRKGIMKISLAENLRSLMVKNMFDKITIKKVCDETGVIRATFYNYFEDKYDCLNWIVYHDVIELNRAKINQGELNSAFVDMLKTVDANRAFYIAAYNNVTGQNSFEDMVREQFVNLVLEYFRFHRKQDFLSQYDDKILARYYGESFAFFFKLYVFEEQKGVNAENTVKMASDLFRHSIFEFLQGKK